ncbi:MAG: 1-deoxy-D-xylulose-5-phosphate synthase [Thermodesulfobacteriota bacterium]|nr:1-deoxy-D-xylulose-5-phosphate synthase [Thermodesulfobacteriota bacterium]
MNRLLDKVNIPVDIRSLSITELVQLADEIRQEIIRIVSKNGGHLASSLGTVELTIALHYVFNTPDDKLIWDVGHQAYTHKILTGRKDRFHTLRQEGGISGFPKRGESPYDVFSVGHSGTSISAALGMAEARCLKGEQNRIIAITGDGSITSGLSFEGFNYAGHRKKNMIVILNDNEMSISPNVGALSFYLNRLMTSQRSTRIRTRIKNSLKRIPGIGEWMLKIVRKVEESFKGFIVPGLLFEELGFKYVGPINGHRLDHLIENIRNVKNLEGPVLIHILTTKGKGYAPAEKDPVHFHGVGSFDIESGEPFLEKDKSISYTEVFSETMIKLGNMSEKIVGITAGMCHGTGLYKFSVEFPERFFDVGIAEQHAITFAAGMVTNGFIPMVAIYSTFMQRAYDQVVSDVCLQELPVILVLDRGGIVGEDGPTHHGLFDYSYLRHIPNIIIMAPKDENELQHMLKTAVDSGRPVSIRYPRGDGYGVTLDSDFISLEIGKAEIIEEGEDVLIIAIGAMVYPALKAVKRLREENIEVALINARFVKPLDEELIVSQSKKIKKVITIEENVLDGGFGSAILEMFEKHGLFNLKIKRMGIPDTFVQHGPQNTLRSKYGLNERGIITAVKEMLD